MWGGNDPSLGWWHEDDEGEAVLCCPMNFGLFLVLLDFHSRTYLWGSPGRRVRLKHAGFLQMIYTWSTANLIQADPWNQNNKTTLKLRGTTERKATSLNSCSSPPAQYQRNEPSAWERRQRSAQCCVRIKTLYRGRILATNHLCSNLETSTSHTCPGCWLRTFRIKSQITDQLILSTHSA